MTKKTLDLGCGGNKCPGSFGVDFRDLPEVDFKWDLEKTLPKKFHNSFDHLHTAGVIDHLGNPQKFLEDCLLYLKKGGTLYLIADNASYWRNHKRSWPFSEYHATGWGNHKFLGHKMMFQKEHLEKIAKQCGFKNVKTNFIHKHNIDYILPKRFGCSIIEMTAEK